MNALLRGECRRRAHRDRCSCRVATGGTSLHGYIETGISKARLESAQVGRGRGDAHGGWRGDVGRHADRPRAAGRGPPPGWVVRERARRLRSRAAAAVMSSTSAGPSSGGREHVKRVREWLPFDDRDVPRTRRRAPPEARQGVGEARTRSDSRRGRARPARTTR